MHRLDASPGAVRKEERVKKIRMGTTAEDISHSGGWLQLEAGAWSYHLMFEKVGTIRAQVLDPGDMVPTRAVLVLALPGPVVCVSPTLDGPPDEVSDPIGEPGDWILIYRSGAKELIVRILPGMLEDYRAKELAMFAGGEPV